ncbi:MAG: HNH endonuclease [Nitrososphaerales archaeon]
MSNESIEEDVTKEQYLNRIGQIARSRGLTFRPNPRGHQGANWEFEISDSRSRVVGTIKTTSAEHKFWIGLSNDLLEYASAQNLFIIEVDKLRNKCMVLPYVLLQPFVSEGRQGNFAQKMFVIVRENDRYFVAREPLDEYVENLNLLFKKFVNIDSLINIIDTNSNNEFYDQIEAFSEIDLDKAIADLDREAKTPDRVWTKVERTKRNDTLRKLLKKKYSFRCQFENCGFSFRQRNCSWYVEAAHIKALASGGPDTSDNVLIVCPNHHKMIDYAAEVQVLMHTRESILFLINGQELKAKF